MKLAYHEHFLSGWVKGGIIMEDLRLYTIKEIASLLKVTERTIYNYILSGSLHAIKIGKYWRVKHIDLERFLGVKAQSSNLP